MIDQRVESVRRSHVSTMSVSGVSAVGVAFVVVSIVGSRVFVGGVAVFVVAAAAVVVLLVVVVDLRPPV